MTSDIHKYLRTITVILMEINFVLKIKNQRKVILLYIFKCI